MTPDTSENSSFSKQLPGLQLAIDSTSLGEFKLCPRRYYYAIICGLEPKDRSVHLTFGLLMHEGRENYDRLRAEGRKHEDALKHTLLWLMHETWNRELGRPWQSESKEKNRLTAIRSLVWYLDQFEHGDPFQTEILSDGRPAVELSFSLNLGFDSKSTGESFVMCGHIDRVASLNDVRYVLDLKTSSRPLDARFFSAFSPNNQFSLYSLASKIIFDLPVQGIIVDGLQVGVDFTRFARGLVPRDSATLDEWLADTTRWIESMETCAIESHWPINDKSCDMWGGCHFRGVCSKSPKSREHELKVGFKKRIWDPLQRRGDV